MVDALRPPPWFALTLRSPLAESPSIKFTPDALRDAFGPPTSSSSAEPSHASPSLALALRLEHQLRLLKSGDFFPFAASSFFAACFFCCWLSAAT